MNTKEYYLALSSLCLYLRLCYFAYYFVFAIPFCYFCFSFCSLSPLSPFFSLFICPVSYGCAYRRVGMLFIVIYLNLSSRIIDRISADPVPFVSAFSFPHFTNRVPISSFQNLHSPFQIPLYLLHFPLS